MVVVSEVPLVWINLPQNCQHIVSKAVRVDVELTECVQVLESFLQTEALNDPVLEGATLVAQIDQVHAMSGLVMLEQFPKVRAVVERHCEH